MTKRITKPAGMIAVKTGEVSTCGAWSNLEGSRMSLLSIRREINTFDFVSLLSFVCRLLNCIYNGRVPNFALDDKLCNLLLTPALVQRRSLVESIRYQRQIEKRMEPRNLVFFPPQYCLLLIKEILINHKRNGARFVSTSNSILDAASLVLKIGDHCGKDDLSGLSDAMEKERVISMELWRNYLLNYCEDYPKAMCRYWELFWIDFVTKEATSLSVHQYFFEATGLPLYKFMCIGIRLMYEFTKPECFTVDSGDTAYSAIMKWQDFESEILEEKDFDCFRKLCATTKEGFEELFSKEGERSSAHYYYLPFRTFPICTLDHGRFVCLSVPYLMDKFTRGIYWTICDKLADSKKRDGFQKRWRHLVQEYVAKLIVEWREEMPDPERFILTFDKEYKLKKERLRCTDSIIFDRKRRELFLFEVTDSTIPIDSLQDKNNWDQMNEATYKIFDKKAKQLNDRITDILSGRVCVTGDSSEQIDRVIPLIVVSAGFPISPYVWKSNRAWDGLAARADAVGASHQADVFPVRILTVNELENLIDTQTPCFLDIFHEWHNSKLRYERINYFLRRRQYSISLARIDSAIERIPDQLLACHESFAESNVQD